MVWNLTSRTIAVRVTPGQGLADAPPSPPPMYSRDGDTSYGPGSTSSPSTVSEVFAPQPGANGLVAVLYGPGNNVAQGAKVACVPGGCSAPALCGALRHLQKLGAGLGSMRAPAAPCLDLHADDRIFFIVKPCHPLWTTLQQTTAFISEWLRLK
ncbi:hypothetical protein HaLaN_18197 [Haematococcus lacustris]|uniref:Uncharacterized protein n=1 Tax=Haematococcus lacustris TaxID=44745 RepID=A0A699ZGC0_HAELA|nr:hypothetical protein HaLaN_18197 [Haematococcus lacustris]